MYIQEPEEIIMNFVRSRVSELTRSTPSLSNRQTTDSESFNGDNSTTEFTLTESSAVVAINTITIGGTEVYPYTDFNIDLDNKTIKFRTAPATGTNNVVVSYEKGSTWVYPDKPRDTLQKNSCPRIGILKVAESGTFREVGSTDTNDSVTIQFDIVSYNGLICTVGSDTIGPNDTVKYLARQLINAIKSGWSNYLIHRVRDFSIVESNPMPFEPDKNIFRWVVSVRFLFRESEEVI